MFFKFDELALTIAQLTPSIVVVTETWFTSSMKNSLFYLNNYSLFRDDRFGRPGGGVAVWISDHLSPTLLDFPFGKPVCMECIWLLVNRDTLVGACYIPPSHSATDCELIVDYFIDCIDELKAKLPNAHVMLCGDFNRFDCSRLTTAHTLLNMVHAPTRGDATLDLILLDEILHN